MMKTKLVGLFLTVLNLHFAAASRALLDSVVRVTPNASTTKAAGRQ